MAAVFTEGNFFYRALSKKKSPISVSLSFILITLITFLMKSVPGRQIIICKVQRTVFIYFGIRPVKDFRISSFSYIHDKTVAKIQIFRIITLLKIGPINTILGDRVHGRR